MATRHYYQSGRAAQSGFGVQAIAARQGLQLTAATSAFFASPVFLRAALRETCNANLRQPLNNSGQRLPWSQNPVPFTAWSTPFHWEFVPTPACCRLMADGGRLLPVPGLNLADLPVMRLCGSEGASRC